MPAFMQHSPTAIGWERPISERHRTNNYTLLHVRNNHLLPLQHLPLLTHLGLRTSFLVYFLLNTCNRRSVVHRTNACNFGKSPFFFIIPNIPGQHRVITVVHNQKTLISKAMSKKQQDMSRTPPLLQQREEPLDVKHRDMTLCGTMCTLGLRHLVAKRGCEVSLKDEFYFIDGLIDWTTTTVSICPFWARQRHPQQGGTDKCDNLSHLFSVTKVWLLSVTKHTSTLTSRILTTSRGVAFTILWIPGGICWVRNQVNISAVWC